MATIINNPGSGTSADSGAAGWVVAIVLLAAVLLIGLFVWPGYARGPVAETDTNPSDTTQINVQLPAPTTDDTADEGDTGGPIESATQ